jgi:hypothetical protein
MEEKRRHRKKWGAKDSGMELTSKGLWDGIEKQEIKRRFEE